MTNSYVERWDRGCDSRPLLEEADREIERLHQMLREARAGFDVIANKAGEPRWDLAKRIDAVLSGSSEPGVVVSDLEITPEMEAEMSRPGQIQFVPSPYVEVGELVLIDEEPGQKPLIFAEWNPVRYELPAGTKLYAMRSLGASRDASSCPQCGNKHLERECPYNQLEVTLRT